MIIHLLRHGETAHNRDGMGLGRTDAPLTPLGVAQARALAGRLVPESLDAIFSSPLSRAADLAGFVALGRGVGVTPRDELIEMDVGETEGLAFPVMRERYADFLKRWATEDTSVRMPGGESIDDVSARLAPFVAELKAMPYERVAVVSHNFITKLLVCHFIGLPPSGFRSLGADLASLSTIFIDGNRLSVVRLNDTCHLHNLEHTEG